jgi:DNA-binding response OmpR family regulator
MRVLVAEDEVKIASFIKKALESHSIAVDMANNGEDALYLASVSDYDVILLDVMLPKMDGVEVCQKLRSKDVKSPVIMISARGATEDKIRGLDSGADDYLSKPFNFSELFARIRSVSRRKVTNMKPHIRVHDMVIDTNKCMVLRDGKNIDLSPREYRLLEYMVRNQGKVLNRFEILENVWGSGERSLSNVVDVHISHLRSKLDRGFEKELIRTVRGGGYILD